MHQPWKCTILELGEELGSKPESGLQHNEVVARMENYGKNSFEVEEKVIHLYIAFIFV